MSDKTKLDSILTERAKTHGDFSVVADFAQQLKDTMRDAPNWASSDTMEPDQYEALEMIASKLARILCGNQNHADSWKDIAGYAMLVCNRLEAKCS